MENRFKLFLLKIVPVLSVTVTLVMSSVVMAQEDDDDDGDSVLDQIITPDLERRVIDDDVLDNEDFEVGLYAGVLSVEDFGSNSVAGIRLAYHITEDFFLEATAAQSTLGESSYERFGGVLGPFSDSERELLYYNISFGYNILPGEIFIGESWAFNSAFYVVAGAGNTDFGDEAHFTLTLGGGLRLFLTDWMAFHIDMRDHILTHDLLGEEITINNLEAHLGLTVFF